MKKNKEMCKKQWWSIDFKKSYWYNETKIITKEEEEKLMKHGIFNIDYW